MTVGFEALVVDAANQSMKIPFATSATVAKIQTFLGNWSYAGLKGMNQLSDVAVTPVVPSAGIDLDERCLVLGVADGEPFRFMLIAPNYVPIIVPNEGRRLSNVDGQACCDLLKPMYGFTTLTFTEGIFLDPE